MSQANSEIGELQIQMLVYIPYANIMMTNFHEIRSNHQGKIVDPK